MADYLLFRLYGPMVSWGDTAVGEFRPSHGHPTRTTVLGLLAAALGIRRNEEEKLLELDKGYRIAFRLDAPGEVLRDYHTTQVPPEQHKVVHYTRRDEINSSRLHTILSQRDYRTDSAVSVSLSLSDNTSFSLSHCHTALMQPVLPLYLGRKSCPLAFPLEPEIIQAASLKSAFDTYSGTLERIAEVTKPLKSFGKGIQPPELHRYYWQEDEPSPGMELEMAYPRCDQLRSRKRWQFNHRNEHYAAQNVKEEQS